MPIGVSSYNATDQLDSVLSILKDISPNVDNYLVSNLKKSSPATNTLHEWPVYNTARPTSVTMVIEGADATIQDLTNPSRSNNRIGLIDEVVQVTSTDMGISTLTGEDQMSFQKREALTRLKAKMEWLTINGVLAAGSSGVAAQMAGIERCISTLVTARASGTSFTETEFNDIVNDSYNAVGSAYVGDVLLCPVVIKRRVAIGFDGNNTRNISATDKKLDSEIRVIDSQVGQTVKLLPHKDVRTTAGSLAVMLIREELYAHSFLAKEGEPKWVPLAKTGHAEKGMYQAQFTVVSHAQTASVRRTGYANTL